MDEWISKHGHLLVDIWLNCCPYFHVFYVCLYCFVLVMRRRMKRGNIVCHCMHCYLDYWGYSRIPAVQRTGLISFLYAPSAAQLILNLYTDV